MKEVKSSISTKPSVEDTIQYFSENIDVPRDLIFVNVPNEKELEKLASTSSGLIVAGKKAVTGYNEFLFTVLAVGSNLTDIVPRDKIYLKVKMIEEQIIDGHIFTVISPFQLIAKKK